MRRKRAFTQKPWNKVPRIEKFWTTYGRLSDAPSIQLSPNTNNADFVVAMTGAELAADQLGNAIDQRALQHVKVHRMQGHIWAWLAPMQHVNLMAAAGTTTPPAYPQVTPIVPSKGAEIPSNIQMVNYVWLKLKADANTASNPGFLGTAADFNPNITHDLANLLERDDVIRWGTVPVYGQVVRMYNDRAAGDLQALEVSNPGQYFQNGVAQIPLPRLPKSGLNLRKGEWLMCYVATWNGPGTFSSNNLDDQTPNRGVVLYPCIRMLCSI